MRVLHISSQKPDSTGSGIYLSGIISGMENMAEEQALICGIDKSDSVDNILNKFDMKVGVYPVVYNSKDLDFNVPGMSDNMPYPSTRYRDMNEGMARRMKEAILEKLELAIAEFKPDIIVCHHLYYISSIVVEYVNSLKKDENRDVVGNDGYYSSDDFYNRRNIKIVAICHGTCLRQLETNDFMKEYILSQIVNLDMIFALHETQKEKISSIFNLDKKKVDVLGSGYNSAVFKIDKSIKKDNEDKIIISYAGKLAYAKGLIEFIKALDKLDYPKNMLRLIFAGAGSDKSESDHIMKAAENCKYEIEFAGKVDQERLSEIFNISDIFVLPSYYEGLPLVLLEAMACGNYIVSTDVSGVRKWLGDEVKNSGIIDYVKLPKMRTVSEPEEVELPKFVDDLKASLSKAIDFRLKNKTAYYDISSLSWDNLAKKLFEKISGLE